MKILLDENFPLQLYERLRAPGYDAEQIICLGQRGLPDSEIRSRIATEEILLLTQDAEFEDIPGNYRGTVIISRVRQSLPIEKRTHIWLGAIKKFISQKPIGRLFDLLETGEIVAWEIHDIE